MCTNSHNGQDERLCGKLCNIMGVALMIVAYPSGTILYVNQKVCDDMKLPRKLIVGRNYKEIFLPEFHKVYNALAEKCQDGEEHTSTYFWTERIMWEQLSAKAMLWNPKCMHGNKSAPDCNSGLRDCSATQISCPVKDADQSQKAILLNITNITEVARKQQEYERAAYFDSLTNLPNGKKLELDIKDISFTEDLSFIYFQIRNYDDIINWHGWCAGDQLHLLIRDWLISSEVYRVQLYKGERGFILLGRGVTKENIINRIEHIIERFRHPWKVLTGDNALEVYCKIRIGGVIGTEYLQDEVRPLLLRTVTMDPRVGKEYIIYDEEEDRQVKANHKLRNDLTASILDDMKGFDVHYQPIVDTQTGVWVGLEALCRWQSPQGEQRSPAEFIPAIDQLGFMAVVDSWVRKQAMLQYGKLGLNKKAVYLDVNYSPGQPMNTTFVQTVLDDIRETGFPVHNLIFEITEAERMPFDKVNLKGLELMRQEGIILSLDDFGTGYSSLENLLKISASALKTDKVLVDQIVDNKQQQHVLGGLINLTHHLGMCIIVEGVETEAQRQWLIEHNADYIQGYYFSRPLTAEQLAQEVWRFA